MSQTSGRSWVALLACLILAPLAGCTPSPPLGSGTPSGATSVPNGHGEIQGSGAGAEKDLYLFHGACPGSGASVDFTKAESDGSFIFSEGKVNQTTVTTFCVTWDNDDGTTGSMQCECDWSSGACSCP